MSRDLSATPCAQIRLMATVEECAVGHPGPDLTLRRDLDDLRKQLAVSLADRLCSSASTWLNDAS